MAAGAAAAPQQQQAAGSVRYPRLDYAKEVPPTDKEFTRGAWVWNGVNGAEKGKWKAEHYTTTSSHLTLLHSRHNS